MYGYLLLGGRLYFKSGNAHHVAAAVQKGKQTIPSVGSVSISVLDAVPEGLEKPSDQIGAQAA